MGIFVNLQGLMNTCTSVWDSTAGRIPKRMFQGESVVAMVAVVLLVL